MCKLGNLLFASRQGCSTNDGVSRRSRGWSVTWVDRRRSRLKLTSHVTAATALITAQEVESQTAKTADADTAPATSPSDAAAIVVMAIATTATVSQQQPQQQMQQ
jgi:hypothetical protein